MEAMEILAFWAFCLRKGPSGTKTGGRPACDATRDHVTCDVLDRGHRTRVATCFHTGALPPSPNHPLATRLLLNRHKSQAVGQGTGQGLRDKRKNQVNNSQIDPNSMLKLAELREWCSRALTRDTSQAPPNYSDIKPPYYNHESCCSRYLEAPGVCTRTVAGAPSAPAASGLLRTSGSGAGSALKSPCPPGKVYGQTTPSRADSVFSAFKRARP